MGTRKQHRNIEVMGLMQGKTDGDAIIVMDAFALPVEGTETRVNAQADAYEYMVDYFQNNKQTPCGHNFCLKGFQKWVGLGKHTCENYRHAIPAKMASNPRINSSLVTAIRMAKMSKANGFVGPPKVHHFVHNQNRPDKAYTIDRAKKSGKANACSGKIFVTVPPDHFWPTSRKCSRQKTGYLSWGNLGGSVGMQAVGSSIFLMLQGYLDNQIMELSLWHSLVGMKMMRTMIESDNKVLPVYPLHAEFARPLWVFGMNSYEFIHSDEQKNLIGCSYRQNGRSYIGILDDSQSTMSILDIPFTDINNIRCCDLRFSLRRLLDSSSDSF